MHWRLKRLKQMIDKKAPEREEAGAFFCMVFILYRSISLECTVDGWLTPTNSSI